MKLVATKTTVEVTPKEMETIINFCEILKSVSKEEYDMEQTITDILDEELDTEKIIFKII